LSGAILLAALQCIAAEPTTRPLLRLETGMHTAPIRRIATDAAGRWAVTASEDKTARVWEVASGRQLAVLRPPQDVGDEGKLYAVALSPDGAVVAVGGWTGWDWDKEAMIYLFDRASGRLLRRLPGLPDRVCHLAFSPDGRWLAASLRGANGVRIFEATRGEETGRDAAYGSDSYSVHFSPDGQRLLTTSFDGQVRLYAVNDGKLGQSTSARLSGGKRPYAARFSPDGRRIAIGFDDSTVVQVLDAKTLKEVARPSTVGVDNGDLALVAWSADGRFLVAGGQWDRGGKRPVRRWRMNAWSKYSDVPAANNTVMDLVALPGGGLLFAAADPAWGVLNAAGQIQSRQDGVIADLRGPDQLRLSADARRVRFGYQWPGQDARSFDLVNRSLGADDAALSAARTAAPGLDIKNWGDRYDPTLNGQPLKLEQYERSRSLAIAPDAERFVLGTNWSLRLFDRAGRELWQQPVPGTAWAVNISADGRFVVVGDGDGTIRWHRLSNGEEVLALFPYADRQRWMAWTPEGFYATSGPDAEELVGYHLNRGKAREGEFISARQLREHFYQPGLISQRLDANGDALLAEAVQKLGDVRELLAGAKAPAPVVELLSDAQITTAGDVPVKVRIKDQGGGIGRLIYRIDGVEFEGRMVGSAADGTDSRTFTLPPQPGQREITVSATNARGVESLPVRIVAQVQPRPSAAPSLHVLAIGVSLYRDKELQKGVRFAAHDADIMGQLFRAQGARLYQSVNVRVLSDAQATGDAIRTALTELASRVAAQDVFVLYLAGHGASFDRDYHYIPWDAVYTSTAALRQRSLTHEHFRGLLAKIPATKTVVLLDTCSAGGFGRQEGRNIGEKDAIDRLSRLTGRAMIAATADDRMAIEGEGGHGAFTFALLEGLRGKADRNGNGTVEVHELAEYVQERLPEITRKWGYEQFPFSAMEGHFFPLVPKP
jgi:WD40 repeat protein